MPLSNRKSALAALSIICLLTQTGCSFANKTASSSLVLSTHLATAQIPEASGIAISQRNQAILWLLNDSGNPASIFAINDQGEMLAQVDIQGTRNIDWEDMASFRLNGKPYLLIADVGDNAAKRSRYYLHFIEEPDVSSQSRGTLIKLHPKWTLSFSYEDGARDCESVAVDVKHNKILLLSKRDKAPHLYELPLTAKAKNHDLVAKKIGNIQPMPEPNLSDIRMLRAAPFSQQPTAMDIAPDGSALMVLTYINAYRYPLNNAYDWPSITHITPEEITLPYLPQAEALSFDASGRFIYVSSEGINAPLLKVKLDRAKEAQNTSK